PLCLSRKAAVLIMGFWCLSSSHCPGLSPPLLFIDWPLTKYGADLPGIAAIPTRVRRRNTQRQALLNRSAGFTAPPCFTREKLAICRRRALPGRHALLLSCVI